MKKFSFKFNFKSVLSYLLIFVLILGFMTYMFGNKQNEAKNPVEVTGTQFGKYLTEGQIKDVLVTSSSQQQGTKTYLMTLENGQKVTLYRDSNLYAQDAKIFDEKNVVYTEKFVEAKSGSSLWTVIFNLLFMLLPIALIFLFLSSMTKNQQGAMSNFNKKYEILDFTKRHTKDSKTYSVTLDDVIGLPKNTRQQLEDLTATIKKIVMKQVIGKVNLSGVLLYGPPGTGKSMMAKALASQVGSFFIHVSGADFVDKFVGQGASNVESLFKLARKTSLENNKAPVIIFIDEIDAIGKKREGKGIGGNDEREATLNAILHNLSGIESEANVFLIGATNFKDSLDEALLRSGRLSTHIEIPKPDKNARKQLFEYYLKKLPSEITVDKDIDYDILSEYSFNMTGADISEIIENMHQKANGVEQKIHFNLSDMIELIETKMYGTVKEELMNNEKVLNETAIHEAGHALLAMLYFPKNVLKACVTPRHRALGYVSHNIMDGKVSLFKEESKKYIQLTLGGLVAERLFFNDTSSGVSNDLEQANQVARNLVQKFGAGDTLLIKPEDTFKEGLSDSTMSRQEEEMSKILEECQEQANTFLINNKELLKKFADLLLLKKVLNKKDIEEFYLQNEQSFNI